MPKEKKDENWQDLWISAVLGEKNLWISAKRINNLLTIDMFSFGRGSVRLTLFNILYF